MKITINARAVKNVIKSALNRGVLRALEKAGDKVARSARDDHPYTDRTGDLTASIYATNPTGEIPAWETSVGGTTFYASYVEHGTERSKPYPYLDPAGQKLGEDGLGKLVKDAVVARLIKL